jgi:hypothetical protein
MSQHDYVLDNAVGATIRTDLNSALAAIATNNSGATEPTTTYAYQWWSDTTTGLLKVRNAANSAWITIGPLSGIWAAPGAIGATTPASGAFTTLSATGSITLSGTGTGIVFPAANSTGTGTVTSNTLDDYEEGTWTPRLEFDGVEITSYSVRYGVYTKIGPQVTVSGRLVVNVKGAGTGLARIFGIPFTGGNFGTSPTFAGSATGVQSLVTVTGTVTFWMDNNGASLIPYTNENGSGSFTYGANYATGSGFTFTMTYFV